MRFHRSESAFALLMSVILAVALILLFIYLALSKDLNGAVPVGQFEHHQEALWLVLMASALQASAVCIGAFLIYPLIRTQVLEEGKLRQMTASLSARSQTLEHAALTDGLTGMHNRRYFDDALKEYLQEFTRIDRPIGLMILDLDYFKQVNDTYGHDTGDEVLRSVAACLKDMTRYHDIVARLGGEEFAIVAPNMELDVLSRFAERIRKAIASQPIATGNVRLTVTASVGIAIWDRRESMEDLYRRADARLYQAKRQGRNRICA